MPKNIQRIRAPSFQQIVGPISDNARQNQSQGIPNVITSGQTLQAGRHTWVGLIKRKFWAEMVWILRAESQKCHFFELFLGLFLKLQNTR
jgi:hypothetical protein